MVYFRAYGWKRTSSRLNGFCITLFLIESVRIHTDAMQLTATEPRIHMRAVLSSEPHLAGINENIMIHFSFYYKDSLCLQNSLRTGIYKNVNLQIERLEDYLPHKGSFSSFESVRNAFCYWHWHWLRMSRLTMRLNSSTNKFNSKTLNSNWYSHCSIYRR